MADGKNNDKDSSVYNNSMNAAKRRRFINGKMVDTEMC